MAEFLPDEELLDFDSTEYAEWDQATADRLLIEEPVLYRNHLVIARWLQQWANRIDRPDFSNDFDEGEWAALKQIIAHLRKGDFVPGHGIYERP
jgi:hypothetical protein